ncbi:hypothetical protein HYR99_20310 [Candidatus Poribacteria bacterium]|nr:hypothetical protein [Candidatus Poribacteria bacterium]
MLKEIWERNALPLLPMNVEHDLFDWLRLAQNKLDISFVDFTPLPDEDLEKLKRSLGVPPKELSLFYNYVTPWWNMRNGFDVWKEHTERAFDRFRKFVLKKEYKMDELEPLILNSPAIWPVVLSQKATAIAFVDDWGRLAVIEGNIGSTLGRPLAVGLRNYIVMIVVAEIQFEEKDYQSYEQVLRDPLVKQAGKWPADNPPSHFLIEAYESGLWEQW